MDITEDQTTVEQLHEAFRGIAADKVGSALFSYCECEIDWVQSQPFVTELDLRVAHLPVEAIEYLRKAMPSAQSEGGEQEYDYEAWLDSVFA